MGKGNGLKTVFVMPLDNFHNYDTRVYVCYSQHVYFTNSLSISLYLFSSLYILLSVYFRCQYFYCV